MLIKDTPLLTNDERRKLQLRIAILEDMVAYLLGEIDPEESCYERHLHRAEKIINKSQKIVRDYLHKLQETE